MRLNLLHLFVFSVVFVYTNEHVVYDTSSKKYEIFSPSDKTKWIQVSQNSQVNLALVSRLIIKRVTLKQSPKIWLEQIIHSIDERLRGLSDKQTQDVISMQQVSSKLEQIDEQLQKILNRLDKMEQKESYNQFLCSQVTMWDSKMDFHIGNVKHKIELNQHQTNSRLSEIDTMLEKIHGEQSHLEKELRRINAAQDKLISTVGELAENSKLDAVKVVQVLNKTRQQLQEEFAEAMQNITNLMDGSGVIRIQDASGHKSNMKTNPNDMISLELNDKYNSLQEEIDSIKQSQWQSLSIGNKIYERLEEDKKDMDTYMASLLHVITRMKETSEAEFQKLKTQLSADSSTILGEQINFKRNCSRLQLHEEHLEDKTVTILQLLMNLITNRTSEIREDFAFKSAAESDHFSQQVREIEQLRLLLYNQVEQIKKLTGQESEKFELSNAATEISTLVALKKIHNTIKPSTESNKKASTENSVFDEAMRRLNERRENSRTTTASPDSRRVSTTSTTVINKSEEESFFEATFSEPPSDFLS